MVVIVLLLLLITVKFQFENSAKSFVQLILFPEELSDFMSIVVEVRK